MPRARNRPDVMQQRLEQENSKRRNLIRLQKEEERRNAPVVEKVKKPKVEAKKPIADKFIPAKIEAEVKRPVGQKFVPKVETVASIVETKKPEVKQPTSGKMPVEVKVETKVSIVEVKTEAKAISKPKKK